MTAPFRKSHIGFATMLCLLLGLPCAAGSPGSLFTLPAESFFAIAELQRPLELQRIDPVLLSAAIFHETNGRRLQHGRPGLIHRVQLDRAAQGHADSMVRHDFISHTNPHDPGQRTLQQRVLNAGLADPGFIAENIATQFRLQYRAGEPVYRIERNHESGFSYSPNGPLIPAHTYRSFAAAVLDDWMGSSGHRQNILAERAEFIGAGCTLKQGDAGIDKLYCVQVFSAP
jgi:uncharacterized protein YkwD